MPRAAAVFIVILSLYALVQPFAAWATENYFDMTLATEYAPGFSLADFRAIHPRERRDEVLAALGEPLGHVGPKNIPGLEYECDLYSRPRRLPRVVKTLWLPSRSWVTVRVCYSTTGEVAVALRWLFSR
jgi:hypothetical protein